VAESDEGKMGLRAYFKTTIKFANPSVVGFKPFQNHLFDSLHSTTTISKSKKK